MHPGSDVRVLNKNSLEIKLDGKVYGFQEWVSLGIINDDEVKLRHKIASMDRYRQDLIDISSTYSPRGRIVNVQIPRRFMGEGIYELVDKKIPYKMNVDVQRVLKGEFNSLESDYVVFRMD
jgi:hypothetical protein